MGVKERREREKTELRAKILDAARQLILEQGVDAISMRKIADRIEYSATAIYQHFPDKEALLHAMCERDFEHLRLEMAERAAAADPVDQIILMGLAYLRFAVLYPGHFRVMFMTPRAHPLQMTQADRAKQGDPSTDGFAAFKLMIAAAIAAGRFRPEVTDVELVAQVLWAAVHGVAALHVAKQEDPWVPWRPLDQRVRLALGAVVRGMLRDPEEMDQIWARVEPAMAELRSAAAAGPRDGAARGAIRGDQPSNGERGEHAERARPAGRGA